MVLEQIHELSNSISKTPMTCFVELFPAFFGIGFGANTGF
jgi:hypothetical protein